jgi:tRNA(Ile)-lysidine synthase
MDKRYVVAVSGGVDSVVLLHMLLDANVGDIVVAHFDHGIRSDSRDDANFVAKLARQYELPFETQREELGKQASEDLARTRRYAFLRDVADRHDARIITAHHGDDVIETVAINMTRGTGWRGLSVMDSDILRPLLDMSKSEILAYAATYGLPWRDDSTNTSDAYLRNRIRRRSMPLHDDVKRQVLGLRAHQVDTKRQIDQEVLRLIGPGPEYSRYFFTHVPQVVALECLRTATRAKLTRPQLQRALITIKTAKPAALYVAGSGIHLRFTSRNFTVQLIK